MKTSPLEHCLLALIEHGECSGYDIRRILTQTPMRRFSDSPGSIYPALQRLQRRRWIVATRDPESRRRRSVYRLAPKGRAELTRWLKQPISEDDVIYRMHELMLRLSFHHLLADISPDEEPLQSFMAALASAAASYAAKLRNFIRTSTSGYPTAARLALDAGLDGYQSLARWAGREARTLQRGASLKSGPRKSTTSKSTTRRRPA